MYLNAINQSNRVYFKMIATSLLAVLVLSSLYIHVCVAATDCSLLAMEEKFEKFDAKLSASLEEIKGMLNGRSSNGNNQHCDQISRIYKYALDVPTTANNIYNGPQYIHISDAGMVYLTESLEQKLHKLQARCFNTLKTVNFDGTPAGIYATRTQVLVADATNKRIVEYTVNLDLVKTIINMPVVPNGVAVDCDNNDQIYVTGKTTGIVYVYNSDGSESHQIKVAEPGDYLRKIWFVNDRMYITSMYEGAIYVYTKAGAFVNKYRPSGLKYPDGLFVDGNGDIYVTDSRNDKCDIYKLNSCGEVIKVFSCDTTGHGGKSPRDVSIAVDGAMWVSAYWDIADNNDALFIFH